MVDGVVKTFPSLIISSSISAAAKEEKPTMDVVESRHHSFGIALASTTAVGVDRDKNSQQAVKWALDHLLVNHHQSLFLLHIRNKTAATNPSLGFGLSDVTPEVNRELIEAETDELFFPYRGICARKKVNMKEVVLEDADVSNAIADFIATNCILNMVVGASTRGAFAKRFRHPDVPTSLMKNAPDFCAVYVISKGKPVVVRSAKGPAPNALPAPVVKQPSLGPGQFPDPDDLVKTPFARGGRRAAAAPPPHVQHQRCMDGGTEHKTTAWDRPHPGVKMPPPNRNMSHDFTEVSYRPRRLPDGRRDYEDDVGFPAKQGFQYSDCNDYSEYENHHFGDNHGSAPPPDHNSRRDMEVEMRRLKLELKQTMDMYSNACKEAITAKQRAKELVEKKKEEARRFREARDAEEAAVAAAEVEKAKCRAAMEAAEVSQRIAEMEARKRWSAEQKAKREAEEKMKALDALVNDVVRYRKYSIEEVELATEYFAESLKIGEGGYGPVFRGCLDHTPVAIKVLRPDAAQGRRQFNQEVEVLSCIRHPNMVLLLGACPEYGCLVYEYMDNGSLEDRLFRRGNSPPIPWSARFRIAAEVATALLFLHHRKPEPLVHRDLKPANILLDGNYVSKIGDVGLARLVPASVAESVTQCRVTCAAGTFCYIDPEYQQTGMLGVKSDIYSLGVMLLQIITARPPMGLAHHVERAIGKGVFEDLLDPAVKDWPVEECLGYAKLALKCSELRRKDRPDLGTVILPELNRLRNLGHEYERGLSSNSSVSISSISSSSSSSSSTSTSTSSDSSEHQRYVPPRRPNALARLSREGTNQRVRWAGRDE